MELARRFALGQAAMGGPTKIWKDRDLSIAIEIKLVQVLVFPVAIYGYETWTLNKAQNAEVWAFEQWCWRRLLRISWTAKRKNQSVEEEIETEMQLDRKILKQKLAHF